MRTLLILSLAACTGAPPPLPDSAPSPAEAPDQAATEKKPAPKAKFPPQGPPTPVEASLASFEAWDGSAWSLSDGRTLSVAGDQAKLGEESVAHAFAAGGGDFGERKLRLLTPCAAAIWEGDAWLDATRTAPACTEAEAAHPVTDHVRWKVSGGDLYTFLPEGRAWRSGPDRKFKHPVGTWAQAEGHRTAVFGKSEFVVNAVGACHLALELPKIKRMNRAERDFPPCPDNAPAYDGLPFTLWKTDKDTNIDLYGPGVGQLDVFSSQGREDLTWTEREGGFDLSFGERTWKVDRTGPCTAMVKEEGKPPVPAKRTWPACPVK